MTIAADARRSLAARSIAASLVASILVPVASPAFADEQTLAQELFDQGRRLMGEKKYDEACNAFAESYKLDNKTGALLNLAVCNETRGRVASAWAEYKDVASLSRKENNEGREKYAKEHVAALEPKLSRLTLTLAKGADVAGIELTIDGSKVGRAGIGLPLPVDPGKHTVAVTAPGHKPWEGTVEIGADSDKKSLEIPVLAVEDKPVTPPGGPGGKPELPPEPNYMPALIASGVGVVGLAVGVTGGVLAIGKWNDRKAGCPTDNTCTSAGVNADGQARTFAWMSDIGLGVGIIGAGIATYLFISPPTSSRAASSPGEQPPKPTAAVQFLPAVGPGFTGFSAIGRF